MSSSPAPRRSHLRSPLKPDANGDMCHGSALAAPPLSSILSVRFANRSANAVLHTRDGLGLTREGRLQAAARSETAALEVCIGAVATGSTAERTLAISRPSGRPSYGLADHSER